MSPLMDGHCLGSLPCLSLPLSLQGVMGREDDPLMATVDITVLDCPGVTFKSLLARSDDLSQPGVHLVPYCPPPSAPCTAYGG